MMSYLTCIIICAIVGTICSIATHIAERHDVDGVLRVITADYDEGTYLTLEANKEPAAMAKKKQVRFAVRPEHYKAQE